MIERGDKPRLRVETAQRFEVAAGEVVSEVARQQLLALRSAYFDLPAAQEKAAGSAEAARLFGRMVDAAQLRLKAGDLAAADVARIRVDALRAQNDARAVAAELARVRVGGGYLLGSKMLNRKDFSFANPHSRELLSVFLTSATHLLLTRE